MASRPEETPEIEPEIENQTDPESTREFTPEEARALRIYAGWIEHRTRAIEGQEADG
jgi:hypothetical protein